MKKVMPRLLLAAAALLTLSLTGCNKLFDYVKDHDGPGKSNYRISSFTVYGTDDTVKATIHYNKWNNPISVIYDEPTTGRTHNYFRYDQQQRLTEFYNDYFGSFGSWHKLYYDNKGNIVTDTVYLLGQITPEGPANYIPVKLVDLYEYDKYNRMIKRTQITLNPNAPYPPEPIVNTYTYDQDGNLSQPGVVYDDKINFKQTNKIWMFIMEDYSLHNGFVATTYNKDGFPLSIPKPKFGAFSFLNDWFPEGRTEITYTKH